MKIKMSPTLFFSGLTFLLGCIILYPTLDYQHFLAQGDHGRDLYAFWVTAEGHHPYQDYWWVYGPLTPYIYSLFFQWLGIQIPSILLGHALFVLITAGLIYHTLAVWTHPVWAWTGAMWFLGYRNEFFFTYNHTLGVLWITGFLLTLSLFLRDARWQNLWMSLGFVILLLLTKLNFGVMTFLLWLIVAWQFPKSFSPINRKTRYCHLLLGSAVTIMITGAIYLGLLKGLPFHEIRQCLPFLSGDQPFNITPERGALQFLDILWRSATASAANIVFSGLLLFCAFLARQNWSKSADPVWKKGFAWISRISLILLILNSHEFLVSGVRYRLFWIEAPAFLLIFFTIATGLKSASRKIQILGIIGLLTMALSQNAPRWIALKNQRNKPHYFNIERGKVFTRNSPQWNHAVTQTTQFLDDNLKPGESFFSLPYDVIYYYLTARHTPTRQLIFFDHINIPEEQERKIITELETAKINWVVISSRMASRETGLGILGKTYCPVLGAWLKTHFEPVARFGDWKNPPGWSDPHGTVILKRRTLPPNPDL